MEGRLRENRLYGDRSCTSLCNSLKRKFFYTFTAVEGKSCWTSLKLLKNKVAIWTYKALSGIFSSILNVTTCISHIPPDNGSELINAHIISFIKENKIMETRSRAYRKMIMLLRRVRIVQW